MGEKTETTKSTSVWGLIGGLVGGLIGGLIGGFVFLGSGAPHQSAAFRFEEFSCHSFVWYLLSWHGEARRGTSTLQAYSLCLHASGTMNCQAD